MRPLAICQRIGWVTGLGHAMSQFRHRGRAAERRIGGLTRCRSNGRRARWCRVVRLVGHVDGPDGKELLEAVATLGS
jgi:hypothetical protein